jgi:hypothetical protein
MVGTLPVGIDLVGGTIKGYGTIVGDLIQSGGDLEPGDVATIGTLTIQGNYAQTGGNLDCYLSSSTSSTLVVTGLANIDSNLSVNYPSGGTHGTNYTVMAYGSRMGDFINGGSYFNGTNRFWFNYHASYSGQNALALEYVADTGQTVSGGTGGYSPTSGPASGGTVVTDTSGLFTDSNGVPLVNDVQFGDPLFYSATDFTVSGTTLTMTSPPEGTADLIEANGVVLQPPPVTTWHTTSIPVIQIADVVPSSGTVNGWTLVAITGSEFTDTTSVKFGVYPAIAFDVVSDSLLYALAPAQAAGTVNVTITTRSTGSAIIAADQYTYVDPVPTVSAISTNSGPAAGGTVLTVTGTNFSSADEVDFGGVPAPSFTVNSSTMLTVVSPPGVAGTVDITVGNDSGASTPVAADQFTYTAGSAPSVTGISPSNGSADGGTLVSVSGSGFTGATGVYFGGLPAAGFTVNSDGSLVATAPPGVAGTVDITMTNAAGSSAVGSSDQFTYTSSSAPSVTAVNPSSGSTAGGTVVTITGTGFTGGSAVSFGSVPAAGFTINADGSITATAPSQAAATVDITVTTPGGTSSTGSADHFTYSAATGPSVSSISPTSGGTSGGTLVTVYGSGFTGASAVSFGSTAATSFTVWSDIQLTALAPALAAGTYDITVTTPSGTSSTGSGDRFTTSAASLPAITSLSSTSGSTGGGNVITIAGSGFTNASAVTIGNVAAATFVVNSDTLLTLMMPPNAAGTWDVSITTPAGISAPASGDRYTYNLASTAAVTSLSASSGSTAGGPWS